TTRPLCDSKSPKAEEPMMIPRTVRAPSNAPMTKYRRMIGPTFVISSYSRSRRRQARKSMSSALDPEFLPDEFLKFRGGGARHVDVRETRLREVGLAPALAPEFRRDRADELGGIDRDLNSPGEHQLHVVRGRGPVDPGHARLGGRRLRHRHHEAHPLRSEEHTSELQSRGHLVCRL